MNRITIVENIHHSRHRLGRHICHDHRSLAFEVATLPGPAKSVTWEQHCDPYDQGDVGSCTGEAEAGLLMTGPHYREHRELGQADAVALYSLATQLDRDPSRAYPPDDTGSSGLFVMRAAKKLGYISGYRHAFTVQTAIRAVSASPVITGINWYEGFDAPIGDKAVLEISGNIRGGHEVCVYGVDVENGFILIRNSWGIQWGNRGLCTMSFATWKRLLSERGDVTVAVD